MSAGRSGREHDGPSADGPLGQQATTGRRADGVAAGRRAEGDAAGPLGQEATTRRRADGAADGRRAEGDADERRVNGAVDGDADGGRAEGDAAGPLGQQATTGRRADGAADGRRAEGDADERRADGAVDGDADGGRAEGDAAGPLGQQATTGRRADGAADGRRAEGDADERRADGAVDGDADGRRAEGDADGPLGQEATTGRRAEGDADGPRAGRRPRGVRAGDRLAPLEIEVTRTLIVAGAIASRDYQDVHHDPEAARRGGAPDVFMNILTTNGLVGRYVTDHLGPTSVLRALALRLGAPNHPGDTLLLSGTVEESDGGRAVIRVTGDNAHGRHVTATVEVTW